MEALPLVLLLLALFVAVRVLRLAFDPSARQVGPQTSAAPVGARTATAP